MTPEPGARRSRPARMRQVLRIAVTVLVAVPLVSACATRSDLQDMESSLVEELRAVRAGQDSVIREVTSLRTALVDSLSARERSALSEQGEINRRFRELEEQLGRLTALVGETQRVLTDLQSRASRAPAQTRAPGDEGGADTTTTDEAAGAVGEEVATADAGRLYQASLQQFRRESYETARTGLQEFLDRFPDHELAPDAQYYVAESYAEEGQPAAALEAYARVLQLHPNSNRAPAALYGSGMVELDRGNVDDARSFFSRVVRGYGDSDEAELARERLEEIDGG